MAKRELTGTGGGVKTPQVVLNDKENVTFKGRYIEKRMGKLGAIWDFAAIDGDAPIRIKTGDKQYADADVKEGDTVSVFGSTQLDDKLSTVKPGEVVEITYLGKKKNVKTGRSYKDYYVAIEE